MQLFLVTALFDWLNIPLLDKNNMLTSSPAAHTHLFPLISLTDREALSQSEAQLLTVKHSDVNSLC